MAPSPCDTCDDCGSDLAAAPDNHRNPAPGHDFNLPPDATHRRAPTLLATDAALAQDAVDRLAGNFACRYCFLTRAEAEAGQARRKKVKSS